MLRILCRVFHLKRVFNNTVFSIEEMLESGVNILASKIVYSC